ncbi:DUF1460 domain-containing protein [Erwinia sp. 198]|uniref:DUF1460 domain-containing protein n=1 Tax=Erwinia sp. 198 TaxID=2022746 RepID=UPI000F6611F3|nr:DUF1460 domain-containing protein [Erwinia sp. 198]RRZ89780.1 DUF1460 domain-containing protein [Erwinia sp. 198]
MRCFSAPAVIACFLLASCRSHSYNTLIITDDNSQQKIEKILQDQIKPYPHLPINEKINLVSEQFIGTPYRADTLIGSESQPEKLVVDLTGVDCFTFIDYVNALARATTKAEFYAALIKTRYVEGKITFQSRKHFFTDWAALPFRNAKDVTATVSPHYQQEIKYLNQKADGSKYLPGVEIHKRNIIWIPGKSVDRQTIANLKTGDFIGIYTDIAGLDVTHVGIFIASDLGPLFRNASSLSKNRKVVDSPFLEYVKNKPGIIVLRAKTRE